LTCQDQMECGLVGHVSARFELKVTVAKLVFRRELSC
jgi:hypothetical protein